MRAVQARANQDYWPACCKQVPPPFPWPGSKKSKDTGKSTRVIPFSVIHIIIIMTPYYRNLNTTDTKRRTNKTNKQHANKSMGIFFQTESWSRDWKKKKRLSFSQPVSKDASNDQFSHQIFWHQVTPLNLNSLAKGWKRIWYRKCSGPASDQVTGTYPSWPAARQWPAGQPKQTRHSAD